LGDFGAIGCTRRVGPRRVVRGFEDGAQLTGFVVQAIQFGTASDIAFDEDKQPVLGFIGFLDRDPQFGNELRPGAGSATGVIIGGHAATRFGELPNYFQSDRITWECSEELAEADRKTPGAIPQFLRALVHARSRSTPHTIEKCPGNYPRASTIGRKCNEKGRQVGQFQQFPNSKFQIPKSQILKSSNPQILKSRG